MAAVAYFAYNMVQRLFIFSFGRKQERSLDHDKKCNNCFCAKWFVAWRKLDICNMGFNEWIVYFSRNNFQFCISKAAQIIRTYGKFFPLYNCFYLSDIICNILSCNKCCGWLVYFKIDFYFQERRFLQRRAANFLWLLFIRAFSVDSSGARAGILSQF